MAKDKKKTDEKTEPRASQVAYSAQAKKPIVYDYRQVCECGSELLVQKTGYKTESLDKLAEQAQKIAKQDGWDTVGSRCPVCVAKG